MQAWGNSNARGLDTSHWQGYINWRQVRADGKSFSFSKLTQGTKYIDDYYGQNIAGAKQNDLLVGAYHFLQGGSASAGEAEAAFFLDAVSKSDLDLPYVVDVEDAANTMEGAIAWLNKVQNATGKVPLVYTYPSFIREKIGKALISWPLWYAFYNDQSVVPQDNAWTEWEFLQYSEKGSVPGIRGTVDLNVYRGTEAELRAKYSKAIMAAWVAETIIATWLENAWFAATDEMDRKNIHELADDLRYAASIKSAPVGWTFAAWRANVIIGTWLDPAYEVAAAAGAAEDIKNIGWLADEIRTASGQPRQNG